MYFLCSFIGELTQESCSSLCADIIAASGMNPSHDPVVFEYPGDMGFIVAAPLQESMVFCDYWIRHKGGFLTLDSCKPFFPNSITEVMEKYGLTVHQKEVTGLSLP
jgi:hypothetical protein